MIQVWQRWMLSQCWIHCTDVWMCSSVLNQTHLWWHLWGEWWKICLWRSWDHLWLCVWTSSCTYIYIYIRDVLVMSAFEWLDHGLRQKLSKLITAVKYSLWQKLCYSQCLWSIELILHSGALHPLHFYTSPIFNGGLEAKYKEGLCV